MTENLVSFTNSFLLFRTIGKLTAELESRTEQVSSLDSENKNLNIQLSSANARISSLTATLEAAKRGPPKQNTFKDPNTTVTNVVPVDSSTPLVSNRADNGYPRCEPHPRLHNQQLYDGKAAQPAKNGMAASNSTSRGPTNARSNYNQTTAGNRENNGYRAGSTAGQHNVVQSVEKNAIFQSKRIVPERPDDSSLMGPPRPLSNLDLNIIGMGRDNGKTRNKAGKLDADGYKRHAEPRSFPGYRGRERLDTADTVYDDAGYSRPSVGRNQGPTTQYQDSSKMDSTNITVRSSTKNTTSQNHVSHRYPNGLERFAYTAGSDRHGQHKNAEPISNRSKRAAETSNYSGGRASDEDDDLVVISHTRSSAVSTRLLKKDGLPYKMQRVGQNEKTHTGHGNEFQARGSTALNYGKPGRVDGTDTSSRIKRQARLAATTGYPNSGPDGGFLRNPNFPIVQVGPLGRNETRERQMHESGRHAATACDAEERSAILRASPFRRVYPRQESRGDRRLSRSLVYSRTDSSTGAVMHSRPSSVYNHFQR